MVAAGAVTTMLVIVALAVTVVVLTGCVFGLRHAFRCLRDGKSVLC